MERNSEDPLNKSDRTEWSLFSSQAQFITHCNHDLYVSINEDRTTKATQKRFILGLRRSIDSEQRGSFNPFETGRDGSMVALKLHKGDNQTDRCNNASGSVMFRDALLFHPTTMMMIWRNTAPRGHRWASRGTMHREICRRTHDTGYILKQKYIR